MAKFRSAFITGASSGLGRAIAECLAARETRVVLAARNREGLGLLRDEIGRRGGRADVCPLDVSDTAAVLAAVGRWDRETGGLDLVVANAGVGGAAPATKMSFDTIENIVRVNVLGALATIAAAIGPMLERGHGTLAGVSSLAGLRGLPTSAAYSASKAALSTYLEALRIELKPHGLSVVDVRPGFVDTPLTRKNRFKMPFLMDVAEAAERAVVGIENGNAVVSFPWQLSAAMTFAESMPDALWRSVAGRLPTGPR